MNTAEIEVAPEQFDAEPAPVEHEPYAWEEPQRETIVVNGYLIDAETGEVLDIVEAPRPQFHVEDLASAEWVLEKMHEAEGRVAGLTARLAAITDQIGAMIREENRRSEWLQHRFGAELEAFAGRELQGQKSRSLKTPFGTLSFRSTPGSIRPLDKQGALAWAKEHAPDAVVTREDLVVTPLKDRTDLPPILFEVTPAGDRFYIKTGVK